MTRILLIFFLLNEICFYIATVLVFLEVCPIFLAVPKNYRI